MAYIAPNTTVRLYKNIRMNNKYTDTVYFDNISAQQAFFQSTSNLSHTLTNLQYKSYTDGTINVSLPFNQVFGCNYMSFINSSFENKFFYAFITKVEYVNNVTTKIYFDIDVMQTYMFDYDLNMCFVEREHAASDEIGENIVAEMVDTGAIKCDSIDRANIGSGGYFVVIATAQAADDQPTGGKVGGLFTGVDYLTAGYDEGGSYNIEQLKTYLLNAAAKNTINSIVNIFMMPVDFYSDTANPASKNLDMPKWYSTLDGYTPRNNKLYTMPYNFLTVDSGNGTKSYRYEWFNTTSTQFALYGTTTSNPEIMLEPIAYNGASADGNNVTETLTMSGFPQLAWAIDSYKSWLAQNATAEKLSLASGSIGGLSSAASLNLTGAALSAVGMAQTLNQMSIESTRGNSYAGSTSGSALCATKEKDFYFKHMCITKNYAKMIDDYFTMYGYAQNVVKVPNRHCREHYTYTKTQDCTIKLSGVPADDAAKICGIYDKGIRFWTDDALIGNYAINNNTL